MLQIAALVLVSNVYYIMLSVSHVYYEEYGLQIHHRIQSETSETLTVIHLR